MKIIRHISLKHQSNYNILILYLIIFLYVSISVVGSLSICIASNMSPTVPSRFTIYELPPQALWELAVVDMATGKVIKRTGTSVERKLIPGSLIKLVVSGALLDKVALNGSPNMQTLMSHDGLLRVHTLYGNLYLTGRGNALVSTNDMQGMVRELSRRDVSKVVGDIVIDDTFLDARGLERKRKGAASHASVGALGLDLHTVAITVFPSQAGKPPIVKVEPTNGRVRIAMAARTVGSGITNLKIKQLDDMSFSITGNITIAAAPFKRRFPLNDPAGYAGATLSAMLGENNISLTGTVRKGETPKDASLIAEVATPDLNMLIRDMNVNSLNVVADNLLLILGAQRFGSPGTKDKGVRAIYEFIESLGLPVRETRIEDGSGLHANNRVTASFMAHYLQKISSTPWFDSFYASLPRAGMEGTLENIGFKDQRFRAKTGRLEDAYALAGYGVDKGGRKVAFAFILNYPGCAALGMQKVGAAVMEYLSSEVFL
jgi:D-alanyl-D-alanine carboxypeptidase/D-alanyl-D-alanine-endopeptidase (penicillin-binding protein 4)